LGTAPRARLSPLAASISSIAPPRCKSRVAEAFAPPRVFQELRNSGVL
jgi:hypothetical protein